MKKIACNILLAGLASLLAAQAQTNATLDSQPVDTNNPSNIVIVATTNNVVAETTNQIPPIVVITNATVILEAATNGVPVAGSPAPAAEAGIGIPVIKFSDAALTVAIESLARRAGINYMLDPKIGFGQPDASGQVRVAPTLSIQWENIPAENALLALLDNYNLQLTRGKKTGIDRITLKDPLALPPLITRVIQLQYAGPSNIISSVQSALIDKRSKVVPDIRTSQLVVVATENELAGVEELLKQLDLPTKQVLIEAKILETTVNPKTVKGIDWTSTLSRQNITFGNGITSGTVTKSDKTTTTLPGTPVTTTTTLPGGREITTTTTPRSTSLTTLGSTRDLSTLLGSGGVSYNTLSGFSPQTAFLNADGLNVALSFLNTSADTKVISEPRMVTLDNQKATIEVGTMQPIVNVTASTVQVAGGSSISYSNLTVSLDVTPRITANDFVEMRVLQSILRLGPPVVSMVGNQQNSVDSFFTRRIETAVLIPSGNTLVMGGLISDESQNANIKVPLLGDIPILGLAFRKDTKERNRQNLIIFITPTIVQDTDFQPTHTKFLQSTGKQVAREEWSAWYSGKPHDWSNQQAAPYEDA